MVFCCFKTPNLDENIKVLEDKVKNLIFRKDEIQEEVHNGLASARTPKKLVVTWLNNVRSLLADEYPYIQELISHKGKDIPRAKKGKLSREVVDTIERVDMLHSEGFFFHRGIMFDPLATWEKLFLVPSLAECKTAMTSMEDIWSSLRTANVHIIGVYGMVGSGKTTIMMHVYNRCVIQKSKFGEVVWISATSCKDAMELQKAIFSAFALHDDDDFESKGDNIIRASKLRRTLQKKKWVIFIDDLWEYSYIKEVGLSEPTPENGCKLIITSRSLQVCRGICPDKKDIIKIELLPYNEAWSLFFNEVGDYVLLDPEIEALAKDVARECAGVPLTIVTIARSMKGLGSYPNIENLYSWMYLLDEIRSSAFSLIEMQDVAQNIKLSYSRLKSDVVKRCLLFCCLFPKDSMIERELLIQCLFDEEILRVRRFGREAYLSEGHTSLNILEKACLLESCRNTRNAECVKVHSLIRDMALDIIARQISFNEDGGLKFAEFPAKKKWTDDSILLYEMGTGFQMLCDSSSIFVRLKTLLLHETSLRLMADLTVTS